MNYDVLDGVFGLCIEGVESRRGYFDFFEVKSGFHDFCSMKKNYIIRRDSSNILSII